MQMSGKRLAPQFEDIPDAIEGSEWFARLAIASVERSADTIFWLDSRACIVFANKAASCALGYSREELLRMTIHDIDRMFPKEAWPPHVEELKRQGAIRFESMHWTKEGRQIPVEVTCNYFQLGDDFYSFAFNRDISERRRNEDEIRRHRDKLEELVEQRTAELKKAMEQLMHSEKLASLGQLVAGVAHELNTPLGNARLIASSLGKIIGDFAAKMQDGTLKRSEVDKFEKESREAIALLESNTGRSADLIQQFKLVAVDQTSVRRRKFSLRSVVEENLATIKPQFKHRPIAVVVDVDEHLELESYPGPLGQALENLVSNSLVHGFGPNEHGTISISATQASDTTVRLLYRDDGSGIPDSARAKVFDPFFTTKLGSGGSGLGLYIVHNIVVDVLGGSIELRQASGRGVEFQIEIPIIGPIP